MNFQIRADGGEPFQESQIPGILENKHLNNHSKIHINPRILGRECSAFKNLKREKFDFLSDIQPSTLLQDTCSKAVCDSHFQNSTTNYDTNIPCVYFNPNFHKSVHSEIEKTSILNMGLKHSRRVHINPKVLVKSISSNISCSSPYLKDSLQISSKTSEQCSGRKPEVFVNDIKTSSIHINRKILGISDPNCSFLDTLVSKQNCENELKTSRHTLTSQTSKKFDTNTSEIYKSVSKTKLIRISSRNKSWHSEKYREGNKAKMNGTNTEISKPIFICTKQIHSFKVRNPTPGTKKLYLNYNSYNGSNMVLSNSFNINHLSPKTKNKAKIDNKSSTLLPETKYKIDRRVTKISRFKNVKKYSVKYESVKPSNHRQDCSTGQLSISSVQSRKVDRTWSRSGFVAPRKIVISNRKLMRIGNSAKRKVTQDTSEHSTRMVRIGGVLYKTSRTKLSRSKVSRNTNKQAVVKRYNFNKDHILYIRGNKFIMDPMGKSLKLVSKPTNEKPQNVPIRRLDIGGVTFVQKSSNVLIRTNTHTARNIVNQAKQKSIAMLTKKLRKNNQHCLFYRRFGKCSRQEKGMCHLVHDPKNVSLCRKFLQGKCSLDKCLLSHDLVPEKMPTCWYFLEGCCVREKCPYPHVKLNSKAMICHKFLQGYCPNGPGCKKRHSYVCPEYEKLGTCKKGKYCSYPHKTRVKSKREGVNGVQQNKTLKLNDVKDQRKRYYQEENENVLNNDDALQVKRNKLLRKVEEMKQRWQNGHVKTCDIEKKQNATDPILIPNDERLPKRPKIGRLPSFIALN